MENVILLVAIIILVIAIMLIISAINLQRYMFVKTTQKLKMTEERLEQRIKEGSEWASKAIMHKDEFCQMRQEYKILESKACRIEKALTDLRNFMATYPLPDEETKE